MTCAALQYFIIYDSLSLCVTVFIVVFIVVKVCMPDITNKTDTLLTVNAAFRLRYVKFRGAS